MKKKNNTFDDFGRIPPNAIEIEEYILGAILTFDMSIEKVISILKYSDFYEDKHAIIYKTAVELYNNGNSPDIILVTNELRKKGLLDEIGGVYYLSVICSKTINDSRLHEYALILVQKYFHREFIKLASKISNDAYCEIEFEDILSNIENTATKIRNRIEYATNKTYSIQDTARKVIKELKAAQNGDISAYSKVYSKSFIDNVVTFANRETIYIAAPGKNGKTKALIESCYKIMKNNDDVALLWFSMEDEQDKILRNMASCEVFVSDDNQKRGLVNSEQSKIIKNTMDIISTFDLKIYDRIHSIEEIKMKYRTFVKKRKEKKCFLVIDNFKKCSDIAPGKNDNEKGIHVATTIESIRNEMKDEVWSCIVVADHVNKAATDRWNKENAYRPIQGDLGGSGRKYELLTQLVFINKLGIHEDFLAEQAKQPQILINGKLIRREIVLKKLVILETAATRNFNQQGNLIHIYWDHGTMQWTYLKNL